MNLDVVDVELKVDRASGYKKTYVMDRYKIYVQFKDSNSNMLSL